MTKLWPVFLVVGAVLLFVSIRACLVLALRDQPTLVDASNLAVAPDGHLFCFTEFSRVLSFDRSGAFVRSWPVPAAGGTARVSAHADRLEIAPARTDEVLQYSFGGTLIDSKHDPSAFERLSDSRTASHPDGGTILIRGETLVRIDPDGSETIWVHARPWPLPAVGAPTEVAALAGAPGAIFLLLAWALRRTRAA